jgi:NAD(P)-dependent dehydrogenase (short-subunit alcohol dehydrogenase family)/rhamnose utilization protein RhaD (predicted bifunctional aldolase and dehydrogenase)
MENRWDEHEAPLHKEDAAWLDYLSGLIGSEKSLELNIPCSLSVKTRRQDVFGVDEEVLGFTQTQADGVDWLRLGRLVKLANITELSVEQMLTEITCSAVRPLTIEPVLETLFHAVIPDKYVLFSHPKCLFTILDAPNGQERIQSIYAGSIRVLPDGSSLTNTYRRENEVQACFAAGKVQGVLIPHQGLLTVGNSAQNLYLWLVEIATKAEEYLAVWNSQIILPNVITLPGRETFKEIPPLRTAVASIVGHPVLLTSNRDPLAIYFARHKDLYDLANQGPVLFRHLSYTKLNPLIGRDLTGYPTLTEPKFSDPAPRILIDPDLGVIAVGDTAQMATIAKEIYHTRMEMALQSAAMGTGYPASLHGQSQAKMTQPLPGNQSVQQAERLIFSGEVALITGAASGIGRACIDSYLHRGAAVTALDINPAVEALYNRPDYLGVCCDITDEEAVHQALLETICHFGGLDMLVLNAGIFPTGCRIEFLQFSLWDQVRRVNLDANLTIMREAYPMLKVSPRGGRVVIIGSRNQRAPGPGAAAYSVSKAAVTQLARVAALEWGNDQIRVNVIHPDSVFDTALYTEEILKNRSAMYGMTVDQYKKRNVLKVEITSHDVSEMAAEVCGPVFMKVTGAQIPLDGGNERVI